MKQLILVLLIASSALTVSAQKDYRHDDRNDRYHYKYDRDNRKNLQKRPISRREMKRQMAVINREFNTRIEYIRRHPHMRRGEKIRKIDELELHRQLALNRCRDRFTNRHRDYAGDDRRFR